MKFSKKLLDIARKVHKTFNEEAGAKQQETEKLQENKDNSANIEASAKTTEMLEREEVSGDIKIADEVISIVAALAAQEVPGVISMSGGLADDVAKLMGKEKAAKGVRVVFDGKMVNVNVYLVVEYGYNIPELALAVQEHVKSSIEDMAGYEVQFVDVHIENVVQKEDFQLEVLEENKE